LEDPEYWVRHVRQAVRFADGIAAAWESGARVLVEAGPDGVLTAMAQQALAEAGEPVSVPVARKDRDEARTLTEALARLHVAGVPVDWSRYVGTGRRADLPTYAFDRQRYWFEHPAVAASADVTTAGLDAVEHPFLGAATEVAGGEQLVLSGRLSLTAQPWLADHAVLGSVLLPGTAFVEMALQAADLTGSGQVDELTLESPLVLVGDNAVQLQVTVGGSDDSGRRALAVYSRPEGTDAGSWIRHAAGSLAESAFAAPPSGPEAWPPPGSTPVELTDAYSVLRARGYGYGPAFQGLRAAWRSGDDVYAEVQLPAQAAQGFAVHPAALDAALHPLMLVLFDHMWQDDSDPIALLPFAWSGVSLHALGTSALRVRITQKGPLEVALQVTDATTGAPVLSVDSLTVMPAAPEQLAAAVAAAGGSAASILGLDWVPLPAQAAGPPAPELVFVHLTKGEARENTHKALALVQERLADAGATASRLVFVTEGAVAVTEDEAPELSLSPVWGLVRSAQTEHPGRFVLLDTDGSDIPGALPADEPQLALREGRFLVPRLTEIQPAAGEPSAPDPHGTVLITGGTGGLGALAARRLVAGHGVRSLLLLSRSGTAAPGADALVVELTALGAQVTVAACDVADRAALARQIDAIPADRPLTGVVHLAGILDDAPVTSLQPEQIDRAFAAKADAAHHLHELTRHLGLSLFVMYSSIAGTIGTAGQANYAAANVFQDALAAHRHAHGLPATSLAWGLWDAESGMGAALGQADLARFRRTGILPLSPAEGMALFDAALSSDRPFLVPARLDLAALRRRDDLPAILRNLVRSKARPQSRLVRVAADSAPEAAAQPEQSPLVQRIAQLARPEQESELLELVRATIALVLDYPCADDVDTEYTFKELGFDSLSGVEFRNQLNTAIGIKVSTTVVYDYPTPEDLVGHIRDLLFPEAETEADDTSDIDSMQLDDLIQMALEADAS
jgi:NAD(P)-dependent dehydrogenase (short-subunit alcohol dehydrogenase family)/acyl carrier protein